MAERDREEEKEKARQRKEEQEEQAMQRKEEQVEHARQRKEEQEEQAMQRKEEQVEHARQRMKEQEEHARQRMKEQEEQAPKTRGKYKTFDDQMEDLKRFKEMHGHANVSIREDKSLGQFCNKTRHTRKNPGNRKQLTDERIARLDALGFNWMSKEYITKSFDERIEDLKEYKRTHGHLSVKRNENISLYQFCSGIRHSLLHDEKDGTRKLTVERIARLDALGFEWTTPH
jgi:chromosome segregation ATPase